MLADAIPMNTLAVRAPNRFTTLTTRNEKAFALVAVIALLVLVALVCLGLLTLSTTSLRGSQRADAQARAQANARMSLLMALGQLQKTLGPDTRISAPASQSTTGVAQPHWVAAYNTLNPTNGLPPVGRMATGALQQWSTDARVAQTNWRDDYRMGWLVSQPAGSTLTPQNPGTDLITIAEIPGSAPNGVDQIQVPRVPVMDQHNRKVGNYAYWVADESAKARLDQVDPRAGSGPTMTLDEKANSLVMAQRADASKTEGYDWHGKMTPELAGKIATNESLEVASSDPRLASKRRDSFTVYSQGVLSDPVAGGLKVDLGAYMDATAAGDLNIDLRSAGRGVVGDKVSFVPGMRYALTGADYGSLRGWRRIGLDASGSSTNPTQISIEPRFPANRATTRTVGNSRVSEGRIADVDNNNRVNVTRASGATEVGTPIHPVIADARFTVDFVYDSTVPGDPKILPLIYPRVKIWNPYNAKLTAANYVVVMPFRTSGADFQIAGNGPGIPVVNLNNILNNAGFTNPQRYFVFSVQSATFEPGQCKVFMPDFSSSGAKLPRSGGNSYAIQYDRNNIANNRLTESASNAPNGAFFLDSTQTFVGTVLTGANKPNIRCTTDQHVFLADGWFLKGATASLNVPAVNVLDATQGANFPSLQSVYMSLRGVESYLSTVDEWEFTWNNVGTRELMSQSDGRLAGNVFAPKQWARHLRLLYPGETPTKFNNLDRTASELHITAASAADWNPRANIHTRFPTSLSASWYWRWRHPFLCPVEREEHSALAAGTAVSGDSYVASPFWPESASAYSAEHFTLFDVQPAAMPLLSLGRLRHASLIPFGWQPAYPIGSSRAPFYTDATSTVFAEVASVTAADQWSKLRAGSSTTSSFQDIVGNVVTSASNNQMLLYDTSFEANTALFDRYFFSGMPRNASGRTQWNGTDALANSRLKRYSGVYPGAPSTVLGNSTEEALKPAAMFLQSGSFNVNSTDVEAWKALLSHLRETKRKTVGGDAKSPHPYSRTFTPQEADGPDSGPYSTANFAGLPMLDDDKIAVLAEAIVDEVKARGPFLSMADFVNHRLAPDKSGVPDPTALYGALDAAIATTSINSRPQDDSVKQTGLQVSSTEGFTTANFNVDYRRMSPSRMSGMPGGLTQGDLLEPLAPVLTVRGDTFVIRAYGEALSPSGSIEARAWCEAVVQRVPEYLQSRAASNGLGNEPHAPVLKEKWTTFTGVGRPYATGEYEENTDLTPINKTFGRGFRISSFRWVKPEDRAS